MLYGGADQNIVILLHYWKKTSPAHTLPEPKWMWGLKEVVILKNLMISFDPIDKV